ncbi:hypothetical protein [Chitinimonas sp.]|uniref:hypothetical protein n=1 Tax=Chitinimonas sp. TaxID=1934313 RepID=UPI002F954C03
MLLLACLLSLAATCVIYLLSPNQRWRSQPLSQAWQLPAWGLSLTSLVLWCAANGSVAGPFAWLTTLMLGCVVLPYFALLRKQTSQEAR